MLKDIRLQNPDVFILLLTFNLIFNKLSDLVPRTGLSPLRVKYPKANAAKSAERAQQITGWKTFLSPDGSLQNKLNKQLTIQIKKMSSIAKLINAETKVWHEKLTLKSKKKKITQNQQYSLKPMKPVEKESKA